MNTNKLTKIRLRELVLELSVADLRAIELLVRTLQAQLENEDLSPGSYDQAPVDDTSPVDPLSVAPIGSELTAGGKKGEVFDRIIAPVKFVDGLPAIKAVTVHGLKR